MSPGEERAGIHCPIGLFSKKEDEIVRLTGKINQARTAADKCPWAQALMESVQVLLTCEHYDEKLTDCNLCRGVSELRYKTAELVVKAGHLHSRRGL